MGERRRLPIAALERVLAAILSAAGRDGRLAAKALLEAELLGQPEFGLRLLGELERGSRLERGAELVATPAARVVDAGGCFGPAAVAGAAREATELAQGAGVGLVGLRGVGAVGRLAPYAAAMAEAGVFGLIITHSPPLVAPHGGRAPVLGTNPIAYAAPSPAGPVVADFATSALTKAALGRARAGGSALPSGSALDADGLPTTDAARAHALLPFGGVKSFLVALLVELHAGALLEARGHPAARGLLAVALAPDRLAAPGAAVQVGALADEVRAAGGRMPGDRTEAALREASASGAVEVEGSVVEMLGRLMPDGVPWWDEI